MSDLPLLHILVYTFALWLGLYLLARNIQKPGLPFAGLGLMAYALGIGLDVLPTDAAQTAVILRWRTPLFYLPSLFWLGATLHLLPDMPIRRRATIGLLVAAPLVYGIGVIGNNTLLNQAIGIGAILASAGALMRVWRAFRSGLPKHPLALIFTATLFFLLGSAALILPTDWLTNDGVVLALSVDFALLGYGIVALDAYDEGEALLPDFLRSFGLSLLLALTFGGQIILVMAITNSATFPLRLILLTLIATVLILQTFADSLQAALERLIFARLPRIHQERATLRAAATAATRVNAALDLENIGTAEFTRYTRRAISHLGNLNRLAANPLTRLPIITQHLTERGIQENTLERATELKSLLTASIYRLKPRNKGDFGTSDEWRYYNALYFPYVVGIKPYSRQHYANDPDPTTRQALEWFRVHVPERTLHNWQNAAAQIIAQDLREQS